MANKLFQENDTLNAVAVFTNQITSALTDPTTVTFKIQTPSLGDTTFIYLSNSEVTKVSTGVYRFLYVLTEPGHYFVRAEGTGACQAAIELEFDVDSTEF